MNNSNIDSQSESSLLYRAPAFRDKTAALTINTTLSSADVNTVVVIIIVIVLGAWPWPLTFTPSRPVHSRECAIVPSLVWAWLSFHRQHKAVSGFWKRTFLMCIDLTEHGIVGKSKARHLRVKDKMNVLQQNTYLMSCYSIRCLMLICCSWSECFSAGESVFNPVQRRLRIIRHSSVVAETSVSPKLK